MPLLRINDSVTIHYDTAGAGSPLVFVHGWSLAGPVWGFQYRYFRDRYRCIGVDLRGHGRSAAPQSGYGIKELVADLTVLFEQLDLTEATLVGWSLGAVIAVAAYPELRNRLRSLMLVSGTPKFTLSDDFPHGTPEKETRGLSLRLRRNPEQALDAFFRMMFTQEETNSAQFEHITREIAPFLRQPSTLAALQSLDTLAVADVRSILADISIPTLLVHGDSDQVCRAEASRYMSERIPKATLEIVAGAGHAPHLSRPEAFNKLAGAFLERMYEID